MKTKEGIPMPGAKRKNQNQPNGGKEKNRLYFQSKINPITKRLDTKVMLCQQRVVRSDQKISSG